MQTPEQIRNHDYLQLIGQTHQQYYHSAPTNTHHQSKQKWKYGKTVFLPFKSKFYYFDLGYANSLIRREKLWRLSSKLIIDWQRVVCLPIFWEGPYTSTYVNIPAISRLKITDVDRVVLVVVVREV